MARRRRGENGTENLTPAILEAEMSWARRNRGRLTISDALAPGLSIRIGARGASWSLRRLAESPGGKKRYFRINLGKYPSVGIREARIKALETDAESLSDVNPRRTEPRTLNQAVGAFEEAGCPSKRGGSIRTWDHYRLLLDAHVLPVLGEQAVGEITTEAIYNCLMRIDSAATRSKTLAYVRTIFRWMVGTGWLTLNPSKAVEVPSQEQERGYESLTDSELAAWWEEVSKSDSELAIGLQLQMLSGVRPSMVRRVRWDMVHPETRDMDRGRVPARIEWPPQLTKMGQGHTYYFGRSPLALDLVEQLRNLTGDTEYLFPGRSGKAPITERPWSRLCREFSDEIEIPAEDGRRGGPKSLQKTAARILGRHLGIKGSHLLDIYLVHTAKSTTDGRYINRCREYFDELADAAALLSSAVEKILESHNVLKAA